MAKKPAEKAPATFTPYQRTKVIAYLEKDAPEGAAPFEITMASDLTMEEVNELMEVRRRYTEVAMATIEAGKPDKDYDAMKEDALIVKREAIESEFLNVLAPYVISWPFSSRKGEPIPAPAEGGGEMFRKAPSGVLSAVIRDLLNVNLGRVDPKS